VETRKAADSADLDTCHKLFGGCGQAADTMCRLLPIAMLRPRSRCENAASHSQTPVVAHGKGTHPSACLWVSEENVSSRIIAWQHRRMLEFGS